MPGQGRASLVREAAARLRAGGIVAFPTETVYGLGADAMNTRAVQRVFELKGRPANNPLIVHVADIDIARRVVLHWTDDAQRLADRFWPGPLTIVLPKDLSVPDIVTAGGLTVAVRQPAHPLTLELLHAFGGPLVGPSANPSGFVSPTTAEHVRAAFDAKDVMILDGGPCARGIESTVISLVEQPAKILRRGFISPQDVESVLGQPVSIEQAPANDPGAPLAGPGLLPRHYAPRTPASLFESEEWPEVMAGTSELCVIVTHVQAREVFPPHHVVRLPADADGYASAMYRALRTADDKGAVCMLIERPTEPGALWDAIRDRLARATARE